MPDESSVMARLFNDSQSFGFANEATLFKESGNIDNGFMKFTVEAQEEGHPDGQVLVLFQHLPLNLTDGRKASYDTKGILKRTEPILIYQYTGFREIGFQITFHAQTPQDAYDLFAVSSLLRRSVLPTRRGTPSIVKVFLGNWFINFAMKLNGRGTYELVPDNYTEKLDGFNCVITSVDLTPSEERFVSQEPAANHPNPQDWWMKLPSSVTVSLGLTVFLSNVWEMDYGFKAEDFAGAFGDSNTGGSTISNTSGTPSNSTTTQQSNTGGTTNPSVLTDNESTAQYFWDNMLHPFDVFQSPGNSSTPSQNDPTTRGQKFAGDGL